MVSSDESQPQRGGIVGVIRRAVLAVGHHDLAAPIRRSSVAADRVLFRLTRGRWTVTAVSRIPALTLMVSNARGALVVVPLQYLAIDGRRYIVGTNWSRPNHPVWTSWLMSRPECRINIGGDETDCTARLLQGDERDTIWRQILQRSPYHADCERKSGRRPRVFRLEPAVTAAHQRH